MKINTKIDTKRKVKTRVTIKKNLFCFAACCFAATFAGSLFTETVCTFAESVPAQSSTADISLSIMEAEKGTDEQMQLTLVNQTGAAISYLSLEAEEKIENDTQLIVELQQLLIDLGYLEGEADGLFGPLTKAAAAKFCEDRQFTVDFDSAASILNWIIDTKESKNLLEEKDLFENEETRYLYIKNTEENEISLEDYVLVLKLENEEKEYIIHGLTDELSEIELYTKNGIVYFQYLNESEKLLSTFEEESAIQEETAEEIAKGSRSDGLIY